MGHDETHQGLPAGLTGYPRQSTAPHARLETEQEALERRVTTLENVSRMQNTALNQLLDLVRILARGQGVDV